MAAVAMYKLNQNEVAEAEDKQEATREVEIPFAGELEEGHMRAL